MGELERVIQRQATGATPALKVDVASMTGGGDASAAKQDAQTAVLGDILTAATDTRDGLDAAYAITSAAATGTDVGFPAMVLRDDALATLGPADGEWTQLRVDSIGRLWVVNGGAMSSLVDSVAIGPKAAQVRKSFNATSQQTGTDLWSPASGFKIRVGYLQIGAYGTTAFRLIIWAGANADTTYSEGTDVAVFKGSFVPSATQKGGAVVNFVIPFEIPTDDHELHVTTDAAGSVDIVCTGYEED